MALEMECEPVGDRRCSGNTIEVCNDRWQWVPDKNCGDDVCVAGKCEPSICDPDMPSCLDSTTRAVCNSDGTGWLESESCGRGYCQDGACRDPYCRRGDRKCDDRKDAYYVCTNSGQWRGPTMCSGDDACIDGVCQKRVCTSETRTCTRDGKAIETCRQKGTRKSRTPCGSGQLCRSNPDCRPIRGARVVFRSVRLEYEFGTQNTQKKSGQEDDTTMQVKSLALRCQATGSPASYLPLLTPRERTLPSVEAPYEAQPGDWEATSTTSGDSGNSVPGRDKLTVTCGLSQSGKRHSFVRRNHAWDLTSEGRHTLVLGGGKSSRRLPYGIERIEIDYSLKIELEDVEGSDEK